MQPYYDWGLAMKPIDTLRVRAMEVRVRLAELATAELTDESRAEMDTLRTEYADNERRQSALMIALTRRNLLKPPPAARGRSTANSVTRPAFPATLLPRWLARLFGRCGSRTESVPRNSRKLFFAEDVGRAGL